MTMQSYQMTQLGGGGNISPPNRSRNFNRAYLRLAFNHDQSSEAEAEYDRLRGLARLEHGKRSSCFDKVLNA